MGRGYTFVLRRWRMATDLGDVIGRETLAIGELMHLMGDPV